MHFWRYRCTLYKLKVFLIHLGGKRSWEPLTLGKLGTRGTFAVLLVVKQFYSRLSADRYREYSMPFCTLTSTQHTTPVQMIEDIHKTW